MMMVMMRMVMMFVNIPILFQTMQTSGQMMIPSLRQLSGLNASSAMMLIRRH